MLRGFLAREGKKSRVKARPWTALWLGVLALCKRQEEKRKQAENEKKVKRKKKFPEAAAIFRMNCGSLGMDFVIR